MKKALLFASVALMAAMVVSCGKKKLEGEVKRGEKMLSNEGFVSKAPAAKIQEERDKLANYKDMLSKVEERLAIVQSKI